MLCDGRIVCGCADPYGKRVLGDARTASVQRGLDRTGRPALRDGSERRRIEVLRRLPAEAAAEERRGAAGRPIDAGPLPSRMYIECTAACNISCTEAVLRAGNRHHADPSAGHARLRSLPPGRRRGGAVARAASTSSTTARRSCTSAPSRCASTSRRRFPHIYLYTSTNGLALTEAQARRLVHSGIDEVTFSIDGATPESVREIPAARQVRRRAREPARDGRREAQEPDATCRS